MASGSVQRVGPAHVSGLWIGEAVPSPEFSMDTPSNPIRWSLTLLQPTGPLPADPASAPTTGVPSVFGAGYFDDSGDIPGSPVLFFTLRGHWRPLSNDLEFVKTYDAQEVTADLTILYRAKLAAGPDGQWVLTGTWRNQLEGTHGSFACRLEEV
ncbi:hypothetical protein T492DRAFT_1076900 [Pavlovales sp. CCMP2436]|nr:hypothetical protein T492DRAFT_1076900 [Pavlovales sp. CCMP2436]